MNLTLTQVLFRRFFANRRLAVISLGLFVLMGLLLHLPVEQLIASRSAPDEVSTPTTSKPYTSCLAESLPAVSVVGTLPDWLRWDGPQVPPDEAMVLLRVEDLEPVAVELLTVPVSDTPEDRQAAYRDAQVVRSCLWRLAKAERGQRLDALGIPERPFHIIDVELIVQPVETAELPAGALSAGGLLFISFVMCISMGYVSLPDWRAQGFMETLHTIPVSATMIAAGVWLALWLGAMGTFLLALLGWLVGWPLVQVVGLEGVVLPWTIVLAPITSAVFASLTLLLVRRARSLMDASIKSLLGIWFLIALIGAALLIEQTWPGMGAWVPLSGVMLATCGVGSPLIGSVSGVLSAVVMAKMSLRVLAAEDTTELDRTAARWARGDYRSEALLLWLLALAGMHMWAPSFIPGVPALMTALSFLACILAPALLAPTILQLPTNATVRLRVPPLRAMLLTPLIAAGTVSLALLGVALQQALWPTNTARMLSYSTGLSELSMGWGLLLLTVFPGVCEELLFRGTLMSLLLKRGRVASALLWQAVAFALSHVYFFKLAPTFLLGLALGWLTLRTRSIWPAVLVHVLHNLLALRSESLVEGLAEPWLLVGVLVGGVALYAAARR